AELQDPGGRTAGPAGNPRGAALTMSPAQRRISFSGPPLGSALANRGASTCRCGIICLGVDGARTVDRVARPQGGKRMQIPVLVERLEKSGYRATGGEPFGLQAEGTTRAEAVRNLRRLIQDRIEAGAELAQLEVPAADDPWTPL